MGMLWLVALLMSQAVSAETPRGIVIVIGGVGGMDLLSNTAHRALPRAGVQHDIREFVWTHGRATPSPICAIPSICSKRPRNWPI